MKYLETVNNIEETLNTVLNETRNEYNMSQIIQLLTAVRGKESLLNYKLLNTCNEDIKIQFQQELKELNKYVTDLLPKLNLDFQQLLKLDVPIFTVSGEYSANREREEMWKRYQEDFDMIEKHIGKNQMVDYKSVDTVKGEEFTYLEEGYEQLGEVTITSSHSYKGEKYNCNMVVSLFYVDSKNKNIEVNGNTDSLVLSRFKYIKLWKEGEQDKVILQTNNLNLSLNLIDVPSIIENLTSKELDTDFDFIESELNELNLNNIQEIVSKSYKKDKELMERILYFLMFRFSF